MNFISENESVEILSLKKKVVIESLIMDCTIKFMEYQKEYYEPGQKLKAEVIFNLTKPEKFNRINCMLWGYAKCKWNEEKGSAGSIITNSAYKNYIKENFDFLGSFDEKFIELAAGEHKFKVSYALSSNLPTSFKCRYGSIKYKICVIVERPWKLSSSYEFPFTIIRPSNLNQEGSFLRASIKEELSKTFKMDFTPEPLFVSVLTPFSGYVPGQTISLQIDVHNQSKTHVKEIKISLKELVLLNSTNPRRKTKQLVLSVAKVSTEPVAAQTVRNFEVKLIVPCLPPNISNCDVIQVSYELRVTAKTSGLSRSPKLKPIPITIGTSPLLGIPNSPSCIGLLPPSYEESQREFQKNSSSDSSDGEQQSSNLRYPIFEFEDSGNALTL